MAYTFKVTNLAVGFVAQMAKNLPVLLNTNKQYASDFVGGNGTTINITIPDYPIVTTGPAIDPADMAYVAGFKSLTLTQYKVAFGADQVTRALAVGNFEDQVMKPYSQYLASDIQKKAVETVSLKADNAFVLSGTDLFPQVADAVAALRAARSYGDIYGCLGPQLNAKIGSSGINYFNPSTQISDIFKNASLGTYQTAEWLSSPDVEAFRTGDGELGTATVTNAIIVDGTTSLVITDAGLLGGEVFKKGTVFNVAGVETVDIWGKATGVPYAFTAQADATAGVGTVTISIKPIYFNKPMTNVSTATVPSGATVTQLTKANKTYLKGIVWDKQSLVFGYANLAPMAGTESKQISDPQGISLTVTKGPNILGGAEIVRVDFLGGFELIRSAWAAVIYFEV